MEPTVVQLFRIKMYVYQQINQSTNQQNSYHEKSVTAMLYNKQLQSYIYIPIQEMNTVMII